MEPSDYQARLGELRDEIDQIDSQLLPLFLRRMACSQRVAQLKGEAGMPVFAPQREQAILEKVRTEAGRGGRRRAVRFHHGHQPGKAASNAAREGAPSGNWRGPLPAPFPPKGPR